MTRVIEFTHVEIETFESMLCERISKKDTRCRLGLKLICAIRNKPKVALATKGEQLVIVRNSFK